MKGRKDDDGKARYSLVPPEALRAVVAVLTDGAARYGAHNWRKVPNARERYTDALMRHLEAWRGGEPFDASGHLHLAHVACNSVVLLALEIASHARIIHTAHKPGQLAFSFARNAKQRQGNG